MLCIYLVYMFFIYFILTITPDSKGYLMYRDFYQLFASELKKQKNPFLKTSTQTR